MANVAWTRILVNDKDGKAKTINPGDTVSATDVGGDDELELLREEGVVRDEKFPDNVAPSESPRTALLRKANEEFEKAQQVGTVNRSKSENK